MADCKMGNRLRWKYLLRMDRTTRLLDAFPMGWQRSKFVGSVGLPRISDRLRILPIEGQGGRNVRPGASNILPCSLYVHRELC